MGYVKYEDYVNMNRTDTDGTILYGAGSNDASAITFRQLILKYLPDAP